MTQNSSSDVTATDSSLSSSSRYSRPLTRNIGRLTKESINQQLVDSVVKSVVKRRQEREKIAQLTRKRSISEDKEDLFESEKETNDGAIMEVSSFAIDHPFLDINKDKEWLDHYRQSQKCENERVSQSGFFQSLASTLRSTFSALNPFRKVEIGKPEVNPNPFIYVNGNKQVNPAYLNYVHYRKQNPLPSAPKENPSTIQTELQSGFSPVPDVNLFLPFDKSSILKSSTNTAKKSKRKAQVQNNAKAVTKSAFKKDVKTKKVALNKPRMIATGSCASQKPYEKKGYLEGFVHSKRRKCLF